MIMEGTLAGMSFIIMSRLNVSEEDATAAAAECRVIKINWKAR